MIGVCSFCVFTNFYQDARKLLNQPYEHVDALPELRKQPGCSAQWKIL